MFFAKSPLRICFAGGGSDIPAFYENYGGGAVISCSINKFVYHVVQPSYSAQFLLRYSSNEVADELDQIQHPLFREAIRWFCDNHSLGYVEVASFADVPSGTGLGSSGAFIAGLIMALAKLINTEVSTAEAARLACEIEIERLGEPVGKQDQFASAVGGLRHFGFSADQTVSVSDHLVGHEQLQTLSDHLLLFYTDIRRSASAVLKSQASSKAGLEHYARSRDEVPEVMRMLQSGDVESYGRLVASQWERKRKTSPDMSSGEIDEIYQAGIRAGAIGGKLVGAGGGGFFMFVTDKPMQVRAELTRRGLRELEFKLISEGASAIIL